MCYYGKKCGREENECDGSCVDVTGCYIADSDDRYITDGDNCCDGGCCGDGNNRHCGKNCGNEGYHAIESHGGPTPDDYYAQDRTE